MKSHHATLRVRRTGVSLTALAVALLTAGAAAAQTASAPSGTAEVEEIIVTGFRNSLEMALADKRLEAAATDSILAEDIGKFPDLNLSESIQRISGVSISRDGGEGRQISVRGLGPQFTRVRINGMEALSTVGSADSSGGTNRSRGFDFNVFASDLFNAITVRKTAEAATEEGSLGATVDLRTARPFDYRGFVMSGSMQASYNDLAEKVSPRGAAMISNTWADGTFGALVSVAYSKRKTIEEGASTVRWAKGTAFAPGFQSAPAGTTLAAVNDAYHPRFPRFDLFKNNTERLGATGSLQWAPRDGTTISLDGLYADFKATREEQYLEAPSFSVGGACTTANVNTTCGIADTDVTAATINAQNTLISGTFNDVDLRTENRFDDLRTKFTQITLSGESALTDRLTVNGLIGRSISDHENPIQTTVIFDQFNVDNYSYDFTSRTPKIGYGTANLTNPGSWVLTQVRQRPQKAKNTYSTVSAGAAFEVNDALTLKAGLDYKEYEFTTSELRRSNGTTTNQEAVIPAALAAIPTSSYSQVVNLGGTNSVIPDYFAAVKTLSLYDTAAFGGAFRLGSEPSLGNNQQVAEQDTGGFIQADFSFDVGAMPVRGNVGVRRVKTEQSAAGFTFVGGVARPIVTERSYSDTLPAMNLVVEPMENFLVRLGAAKVMARPNLGNLIPGATVSVSGANRTITVGNPNLEPFRAKTYDLAFEWYFQKGALASLALFKKETDTFVQTLQTIGPFASNAFGLPDSIATAACGTVAGCSAAATWTFSTPINTPGGDLTGFELNYQQPLSFLPGFLRNTGFLANYTYVKSVIDYRNAAGAIVATNDLTNLSRKAYNLTFYYEDERITARVSGAFRDRYLSRVPGQEAGTDADGYNETFNVDASLQYNLSDKITLSLEGVNLTDEYQDQFNDTTANRMSVYHHTGREVLVGVRYRY
jgi:iron complex outermembrane recepter protein